MMKIAIQEALLPGRTPQEKFQRAVQLGLDGIEIQADQLDSRIDDLESTLQSSDIAVSGVHMGRIDGYLSPDLDRREEAIGQLRQAMAQAVDLGADHVIFVPHYGQLQLPDLTPYRSAEELSGEMMVWLLRTISDLAYALGVSLHMQPINHYETDFMTRLAQAAHFSAEIDHHPHVRIAPCLFDMALEENDVVQTLQDHGDLIGYVHLCDSNHRLPGQGLLDFEAIAGAFKAIEYDGWLTLISRSDHRDGDSGYTLYDTLPRALDLLRSVGLC
jgi:sugar phosphate isomerase/epimerase